MIRTGFRKRLRNIYIKIVILKFSLRKFLLGFDNACKLLLYTDKEIIIAILRKYGAVIGKECDLESPILLHNCRDFRNLKIGNNCHVGKNCFFDLRDKIVIADNVVISMQTTILTHIDMSKSNLSNIYHAKSLPVTIGANSYVAANSTIICGITLSNYSFIAAGSVVTKDVAPFTMVGGVPARKIKDLATNNI